MWEYTEHNDIIPNCTVRKAFKDGVHKNTRLIANEGYKIHYKEDNGYTDEEGNYFPPSYSDQLVTAIDVDVAAMYEAVPEGDIDVTNN